MLLCVLEAHQHLISGTMREAADFRSAAAAVERALGDYRKVIERARRLKRAEMVSEMTESLNEVVEHFERLRKIGERIFAARPTEISDSERHDLIESLWAVYEASRPPVEQAIEREAGELTDSDAKVSGSLKQADRTALIAFVLSLVLGCGLAMWVARSISRPISDLIDTVLAFGRGNLELRARVHSQDEIGQVAAAFNRMATDLKSVHALKTARDAALQVSLLKSEFLANMSHEVRTPMNVILGYSSLIADDFAARGDRSQDEILSGIQRAGKRLLRTIQGVLDLSRLATGEFELNPAVIELAPLVQRETGNFESLAREKSLSLSVRIEEQAVIRVDEYCLSQALSNVLSNAVKFTRTGGITVRLCRDRDGQLCIEIADTGVGVDEKYLSFLFDAFSQECSGSTRPFEGTGLGLALTKKYLELNRAGISVQSRKGRGTVFRIHLPKSCEVSEEPTTRPQQGSAVREPQLKDRAFKK